VTIRRVLATGDHQCGSFFGLWPDGFKENYKLNKLQEYLWACWLDQCTHMPILDTLVLMGEGIDGNNHKADGDAITENSLALQASAFLLCIKPLLAKVRDGGRVYVMRSSPYHSGPAARADQEIGERLDLLSQNAGWILKRDLIGRACQSWVHMEEDGVNFDLAHHRSAAQVNRSMPLEREGRYNDSVSDLLQGGADDVIIRAHSHVGITVNEGYRWFIGLPPWKFEDDFVMAGAVPNRTVTRFIGSTLIETDGEAKRAGKEPVVGIRKFWYRHPIIPRDSA
jgi:hypothetical protein